MNSLPPVGLGTWQNTDPEVCISSVRTAIEMGYRHIDTAKQYCNEQYVGTGINSSSVPREEIFVSTKVHPETFGLGYDQVVDGVKDSLERMDLGYIDLLYVHWPVGNYDPEGTLPALDDLRSQNLIKNIGLSNFSIELLEEARNVLNSPLFAHQVEMHPLLHQKELLSYARTHDHYLIAYSPLARGKVVNIPEIQEVAKKNGVSEAQVSLAWLLSKDCVRVIPKASSAEHIRDNLGAIDLSLDDEDVENINNISRSKRFVERDGAPWQV